MVTTPGTGAPNGLRRAGTASGPVGRFKSHGAGEVCGQLIGQ